MIKKNPLTSNNFGPRTLISPGQLLPHRRRSGKVGGKFIFRRTRQVAGQVLDTAEKIRSQEVVRMLTSDAEAAAEARRRLRDDSTTVLDKNACPS